MNRCTPISYHDNVTDYMKIYSVLVFENCIIYVCVFIYYHNVTDDSIEPIQSLRKTTINFIEI